MDKDTNLTYKQQVFCENIIDPNLTQAECYEIAFGTQSSKKQARSSASKLLVNPLIKEEINKIKKEAKSKSSITQLQEIDHLKRAREYAHGKEDTKGVVIATLAIGKYTGTDTFEPPYYMEIPKDLQEIIESRSQLMEDKLQGKCTDKQFDNSLRYLQAQESTLEKLELEKIDERLAALEEQAK